MAISNVLILEPGPSKERTLGLPPFLLSFLHFPIFHWESLIHRNELVLFSQAILHKHLFFSAKLLNNIEVESLELYSLLRTSSA